MSTELLTGPETARLLKVQPQTLRAWRTRGGGPAYVRLGGPRGRVRYALQDVHAFLAARTHSSTSAEVASGSKREGGRP